MIAAISPNRSNPARILKIMSRLKKIFSKPFITVAATLPPLQLEWVDFRIKKGRDKNLFPSARQLSLPYFRLPPRPTPCHFKMKGVLSRKIWNLSVFLKIKSATAIILSKFLMIFAWITPRNRLPEYVLTAEITDYFMNLCDEYDWNDAKKANLRTGSAQMTVTYD